MQIKTTLGHHLPSTRMARTKKQITKPVRKRRNPSPCAMLVGMCDRESPGGTAGWFLKKLNIESPRDPAGPPLETHATDLKTAFQQKRARAGWRQHRPRSPEGADLPAAPPWTDSTRRIVLSREEDQGAATRWTPKKCAKRKRSHGVGSH